MRHKRFTLSILILMMFTCVVMSQDSNSQAADLMAKTNWKAFSKNLEAAVKSGNTGLQVSAMQLIIKYGNRLKVSGATLELVKLYRTHKDERVRQMALVTINTINNDWAAGIVARDFAFEKSQRIKRMMVAIIKQNQNRDPGI